LPQRAAVRGLAQDGVTGVVLEHGSVGVARMGLIGQRVIERIAEP